MISSHIHQREPGTTKLVRSTSPSLEELYRTLRLCLRYVADGNDIFNRLVSGLEAIHFIPLLAHLSEGELHRLVPMLCQKLGSLRLQVSDIPKLHAVCQEMDVPQLLNTRNCIFLGEGESKNTSADQMELLGEVLPNLEVMHVSCSIQGHFPVLEKVRTLHVENTSQATLEDLLQKCPQLERLELSDKNGSRTVYDLQNIGLCKLIKELLLPLEVRNPLAICHLANLSHLSLQRRRLWTETDWLPTVLAIIRAKRFALERLTFDGAWLGRPLIVSKLQLAQCTALKELRLSNCKVTDGVESPLPLSCQQISFRRCTLNKLHGFLATQHMLKHLELFDCRVEWSGSLLQHVLGVSKSRPGPDPLHFHFSQSTRLRSEYTKLTKHQLEASKAWLQVREVEPPLSDTWKQPLGMITMKFGRPIDHLPNVQLPLESIPVAAELLKELD